MPTTQPLDEEELGEIAEGPLKPIVGFAQGGSAETGQTPRAAVPQPKTPPARTPGVAPTTAAPLRNPGVSGAPRFTNMRSPGVSLSGQKAKLPGEDSAARQASAPSTVAVTAAKTPYTDSDISAAWQDFTVANSAEHLLINAMRAALPQRMAQDRYKVAQSRIHLGYISENIARITDFVRQKVKNEDVEFILEEVSEDSPLVWSERELLRHIVENNPATADFITSLKLSIL